MAAQRPDGSPAATVLIVAGSVALLGLLAASAYMMSSSADPSPRGVPPEGGTDRGGGAPDGTDGADGPGGVEAAPRPPRPPRPLRPMSMREQGAADMVADIERKWKAGELSRYQAQRRLDEFFRRYPETGAAEAARKLRESVPQPEPGSDMWYIISGFPNKEKAGFDVVYPPESEIELKKEYPLEGGSVAAWRAYEAPEPTFNLRKVSKRSDIVYYAFAYLLSAADQDVEIFTNSDDGIKAWVNGELIVAQNVARGVNTDPDTMAEVRLKKGHNSVLVKIMQGGGAAALKLYVSENEAEVFRTTQGPAAGAGGDAEAGE